MGPISFNENFESEMFIFSYNLMTVISSVENSTKTNLECVAQVKTGSHVAVSQSGPLLISR